MDIITRLQRWWQVRTGQIDTPFDGESPFWVVSLIVHLVLLIALAFTFIGVPRQEVAVEIISSQDEELIPEEDITVPQEFNISKDPLDEVGADSDAGAEMALSKAEFIADISEVPTPVEIPETKNAEFHLDLNTDVAKGIEFSNVAVKGSVGENATGASGAIDRITQEILVQLEERPTTVVWLFDQSASLLRQRQEVLERIDRVYEQLSVIEATGNEAFSKHTEKPLLTSVFAFGESVSKLTAEPTDNVAEIKEAIAGVERDDSGIERVFTAIYAAAKEFEPMRKISTRTREPKRNVMLIVISDEAGDDLDGLDPTVQLCRKLEMPVYVIGIPAPFGRRETPVKWVDPDPNYDQTPQWTTVNQGPESLAPEGIKLYFAGEREDTAPIDSGFGPYALTRICYETGGIYFAVHPNRRTGSRLTRQETDAYSAYLSYFFDRDKMRRYQPDYVSAEKYWELVSINKSRMSLVQAAQQSWVKSLESPQTRFEKLDEASFVREVTLAQQKAASLEPTINELYASLSIGESDREKETSPRWQAGYDLAMGRVLAVKVRTESYNMMLAQAKTGLKFKDPKSNTWNLEAANEISTGSQMKKYAEKAKEYLQRVIDEHDGTPWALMAKRELETPLGWKWEEEYVAPPPPPPARPAAPAAVPPPPPRPATPADEKAMMLNKPKEMRPPPKL